MDFIDSDNEINYTEEDIVNLCKDDKDHLNIDEVILRREKKERRKFYETTILNDVITDIEIGKKVLDKYKLAIETNTPIEFIYDEDGKSFSIRNKLKNNDNIIDSLKFFKNNYVIELNQFVFAYYFSNIFKSKTYIINQLNKLTKLSNITYLEDEWLEKKNRFNTIFEDKMLLTKEKYIKIKKFYDEINDFSFSNSPEKINESLILEKTKVEVIAKINKYFFDIDSGAIIFDEIRLNKNFPYMQYNSFEDKYYKIYDKDINIENIINIRNFIFSNLDEDEGEKENTIYILSKIEIFNKPQYILLTFNLENSKLIFEYPLNTSFKIYDDLKNLINGFNFKDEKTISIRGSFEMKIDNFKDLNLYYLTLFDEKIGNFLYVNENKRPRSLMKNVKYYYKTYQENYLESDYFITFYLEQVYINRYVVNFRSKVINKENNINEFALVFSKLISYYQEYNFENSDLPIILSPYTGPQGNGLGDNLTDEELEINFTIKGKKITNLRNRAPEIFPINDYARKCGCSEQPIIIDPEDVEDWENYVGKKSISVFPPPDSIDKFKKKHIFVCPTDNSIMNYIINPDSESPFPILPCCSKQKKTNYYENYDEIKKDPEKFFNIKEIQKLNVSKIKLKTIKPLTNDQEGNIPESLEQFLGNIYPDCDFIRYGVIKNSKSSFFHCCLKAADHLEELEKSITNERYLKNIKYLIKYRNLYLNINIGDKDLLVTKLKTFISESKGIKINKEIVSQELYNYDSDFINYTLENEIFDSNIFYKLMEYLFFVNIFVFEFDDDNNIKLEKPRHIYYHQREIREELNSILILKHKNTKPPTYELIKIKQKNNDEGFLLNSKVSNFMKKYINKNGYYISRYFEGKYNVTKNFYDNINWNYILKDYLIIGQFINDSGRTYAINFQYSENKNNIITIFIDNTFPLDVPKANRVYKTEMKVIKKIFGNKYIIGSEGVWYELNKCPKSIFIPLTEIEESKNNICYDYLITEKKSNYKLKFKKLNIVKRNANIITQIILWIWNITTNINDLDEWFNIYIAKGDKRIINSINNSKLLINYRFPLDIKNPEEAIEYYSDYIPVIFGKNQIFLYDELEVSIYQYIKNYITKTEGFIKIPNKAIVNIFNNEIDFSKKPNNKNIIGEKTFDEWINFIENNNKDTTNIDDTYINQKRGFLYKNNNGNIFIIQNNINNSLLVSLLISKIWLKLKINLGYYTTMISIWEDIKKYEGLKECLNLTDEKIINLAKNNLTHFQIDIKNIDDAIEFLKKEKIDYELDEKDFNYIVVNYEDYIDKENFKNSDPYNLFSYENGAFASMLNII